MSSTFTVLPVIPGNLPHKLKRRDQWLVWQLAHRDGKVTKLPINARSGTLASATGPHTWCDFQTAHDAAETGNVNGTTVPGVGFVLSDHDPFVGIDIDHVDDHPELLAILPRFDTYQERSPSGTGVHIWLEGELPGGVRGRRKGSVEIYQSGRFLTVTGHKLDGVPSDIRRCPGALLELWQSLFPPQPLPDRPQGTTSTMVDAEVLKRCETAKNGTAFTRLYHDGNTSGYDGDDSAADLALLSLMAFWTQDPAQLERLFAGSVLGRREKWTRREDYRRRTMAKALERSEVYTPPGSATLSANGQTTGPGRDEGSPQRRDPFPIHTLPPAIRTYLEAAARSVGVPVEMIAFPLLALLGSVIGNRLCIQLKRGYTQYPTLWVVVIAPIGAAKSPALSAARWPIDTLQKEAHETYTTAVATYETELEQWNQAKPEDRVEKPVRPRLRHFFSSNLTVEALVAILGTNPGVAVIRDELAGFLRSMDQYRSGKGSDRQEYLSLHAGAPIKADRRTGESVYQAHPVAAIIGGVQPDVMPQFLGRATERDGMLERFIPVVPEITRRRWTDDDIDPDLLEPVVQIFRNLERLSPKDGERDTVAVRLDQDARAVWSDWYNLNADAQHQSSGLLASFTSKLPNHVARLALVLNAVWNEDPRVFITASMLERAIELGEFIRQHIIAALPLFGEYSTATRTGLHARILRILRMTGEPASDGWVQRSVILRALGNVAADAFQVSADYLETEGIVEHRRDPDTRTKPAELWRISPGERSKYSNSSNYLPLDEHNSEDNANTTNTSNGVEPENRPEPIPLRPAPLDPTGTDDPDVEYF